nr:translational initiation factor 1 [Dysosma versipellis]
MKDQKWIHEGLIIE